MKRTLIVTLEYPPTVGGIATYVHDLASQLDPQETIVLAPKHPKAKEWDDAVPYAVMRKNMYFPSFIWPRWIRLCLQVRNIVKEYGVERILIHHMLPAGYAAVWMKKRLKVPFMLFSHGTDLVAGTSTKWKRKMITKVSSQADEIIFNSESLKRRYLQVLPQFEEKSFVVYPCPEKDFLTPPSDELIETLRTQLALQGRQVMLSVGRIADGKGFTHLARLLPELLTHIPHLAWIVIGDGPKKKQVVEMVQKHSLQSIVRVIGEIPHSELKKYYYLADFFAVLTHPDEGREEGLGLVFLEAAAAGLPIVAGKSGGVEEAVLHDKTGIVVDLYKGDEHLVETIGNLANDKARREQLAGAAKQRIETEFVWEKQIERILSWLS